MLACTMQAAVNFVYVSHHAVLNGARREPEMHMIGLVILAVIGMTLVAGLSMTLYTMLPQSVWECAARHGRFAGAGTPDREHTPAGTRTVTGLAAARLGRPG